MKYKKTIRFGAFVVCLGASAAFVGAATGATGAFFSDTKHGSIKGTIGAIKISTLGSAGAGTDHIDLNFADLFPGEPQSVTINYENTGNSSEDVWLAFPNVPALHALNNLGSFGEVTVTDSSSGVVFHSTNLQDGRTRADLTNSCGSIFDPSGCWPLPTQVKVRAGLPHAGTGTVTFTFSYPGKLSGNGPGAWNSYPATGPGSEAFGPDAAGPAGDGLPMNVIATQVGHAP